MKAIKTILITSGLALFVTGAIGLKWDITVWWYTGLVVMWTVVFFGTSLFLLIKSWFNSKR